MDKHRRLMQAMDAVRARYGHGARAVGAQGTSDVWRLRQERLTQRFATCWEEVPGVGEAFCRVYSTFRESEGYQDQVNWK